MSRRCRPASLAVEVDRAGAPSRFRWRGRRYEVCAVLAHWVEALPWWVGRASGQGPAQRQVWRVEAIAGTGTSGVYDLARASDAWSLDRVLD